MLSQASLSHTKCLLTCSFVSAGVMTITFTRLSHSSSVESLPLRCYFWSEKRFWDTSWDGKVKKLAIMPKSGPMLFRLEPLLAREACIIQDLHSGKRKTRGNILSMKRWQNKQYFLIMTRYLWLYIVLSLLIDIKGIKCSYWVRERQESKSKDGYYLPFLTLPLEIIRRWAHYVDIARNHETFRIKSKDSRIKMSIIKIQSRNLFYGTKIYVAGCTYTLLECLPFNLLV